MKISIIMAVFNEEKFLDKTLLALTQQTLKPNQIIIVDDGSTDKSPQIIAKYPFTVKRLAAKKEVSLERYPVVLSIGSRLIQEDFDYVGILDADVLVEQQYYQKLTQHMEADKIIGIAGGELIGQQAEPSLGLMPYVYGANRLYSRNCWLKLNSGKVMKPVPQIDFHHNIYAEMLGFKTERFSDLKSWHLRPSRLGNAFVKGYHSYELGYYGYYVVLRAIRNRSPSMIAGYLKARFSGRPQYLIKPYVRYLQNQRIIGLIKKVTH
jgi:glycosyltransferase involved in cell wall biosynthesis